LNFKYVVFQKEKGLHFECKPVIGILSDLFLYKLFYADFAIVHNCYDVNSRSKLSCSNSMEIGMDIFISNQLLT
jgi:hypothetical protein